MNGTLLNDAASKYNHEDNKIYLQHLFMYHIMSSKSILITGGLGQVGSYLTDHFCENNNVTVLDNASSPCRNTVPEGVKLVIDDIGGPTAIKLVENADIVIHTAAQVSVGRSMDQPLHDVNNNVLGTLNLLEAARNNNIDRFVYFSSAAVYGNPMQIPVTESHPTEPLSPYGVSKLAGEKYAMMYHHAFGIPVVCIRPFNIYSPRQDPSSPYSGVISKFIERAKANQPPIIFGDGKQTRDFISVHDIVELVDLVIQKEKAIGSVLNAGTGVQTPINTLAEEIMDIFCSDLNIKYEDARTGDIIHSVADISAANRLGFKPDVDLKEGLEEFL